MAGRFLNTYYNFIERKIIIWNNLRKKENLHFLFILIVYLAGIVYVSSKDLGIISDIVCNSFVLFCCFQFFETDFGSEQISVSKEITGNSMSHQIFLGVGYGAASAITYFAVLTLTMGLQPELQSYSFLIIVWQIFARVISAFGEDLLFRYYIYEKFRSFKFPVLLSSIFVSLLYGIVILISNQILMTGIEAVVFSAFLLYLRLSKQRESYVTLSVCHFVFNFFCMYIFLTMPA